MRFNLAFASIIVMSAALAFGDDSPASISTALGSVRSGDPAVVQRSIDCLRGAGPDGLAALLDQYDAHPDPKLIPAIDAVAGQRGAVWSRLYWYTDLTQAQAAAQQQQKPILYLRLMGKLTDEYSCANSRFFRTVLYSNQKVSGLLRNTFVLVWSSERPVPVVTIDYGDGRSLKRTLTGNSIHYVLDWQGNVIDALPGLFDPVRFSQILEQAAMSVSYSPQTRANYLDRADDTILRQWKRDVSAVNAAWLVADAPTQKAAEKADAAMAMRRAVSKSAIEMPLLRGISPQFAAQIDQSIDALDGSAWQKLAALHIDDAALDDQSIAVIRGQNPAVYADTVALDRTVHQFQQTIAEDSVRDNYQMRRQVLAWLRESMGPLRLEDLNRRVYNELFLTPKADPWLGLMPGGFYTALTDDGCCSASPK